MTLIAGHLNRVAGIWVNIEMIELYVSVRPPHQCNPAHHTLSPRTNMSCCRFWETIKKSTLKLINCECLDRINRVQWSHSILCHVQSICPFFL